MKIIATALLTLLVSLQMVAGKVTEWHFSNEPYKKAFKAGKAHMLYFSFRFIADFDNCCKST